MLSSVSIRPSLCPHQYVGLQFKKSNNEVTLVPQSIQGYMRELAEQVKEVRAADAAAQVSAKKMVLWLSAFYKGEK